MQPGTIGWLTEVLKDFPPETKIFIAINDKLVPLGGKIDKVILTYSKPDEPEITMGEETICLYPHQKKVDPPEGNPDLFNRN